MSGREGTACHSTGELEMTAYFYFSLLWVFCFLGDLFFSLSFSLVGIKVAFGTCGFFPCLGVTATDSSGIVHFNTSPKPVSFLLPLKSRSPLIRQIRIPPPREMEEFFLRCDIAPGLNIRPRLHAGFLFRAVAHATWERVCRYLLLRIVVCCTRAWLFGEGRNSVSLVAGMNSP